MNLITPYGGALIDLLVPPENREEMTAHANRLPSVLLTERAICVLEFKVH